jgi:acetyl-CoA acetyltransferase family protein
MPNAVIVEAVRSPMGRGKPGGALSTLHPVELLAQVIAALLSRVPVDPGEVDDVLVGCVSQGREQAACPGRWAWLAAGLPEHVPATTIDRRCGSSQQAAHFGAQGIMAGVYDIVVVAGVESMSRVPLGSARQDADPFGPTATARYAPGLVPQGVSAELIAARWGLDREQLDIYAARSHSRAATAAASGKFGSEIVPIVVPTDAGPVTVGTDETIRASTSIERLATLPTSFASDEMARRFPEIEWRITAGNSSQLTDGASAMLLMSDSRASQLGVTPRARFHAFAVCGTDPITMLTGPIPVTHKILARSGMKLDDMDHVEVNEAFAPIPLAWQAEFPVSDDVLNPRGGAIALGHPLGASGARLMTTMVHALEDRGGRYGLQTMCEGGGMANATIIERL